MGMAVAIAPGLIMLIGNVLRYQSVPHLLKIGKQVRFIFYGGYSRCRAGYEQSDDSTINTRFLDIR